MAKEKQENPFGLTAKERKTLEGGGLLYVCGQLGGAFWRPIPDESWEYDKDAERFKSNADSAIEWSVPNKPVRAGKMGDMEAYLGGTFDVDAYFSVEA